jgi:transposase-like protein
MATSTRLPTTLLEALRYFADPDVATEYVAKLRWPDGPTCPRCDSERYSYLSTRRLWKCRDCKKQYSVKLGTIFEDSAIPLDKWLAAIWLIANAKNGVSSHELARSVGITQKSAWFVLHRIRLAMQTGSFDRFDGEVEADETFVGGKAKFMHKSEKAQKISGSGWVDKTIVAGALQRSDRRGSSRVQAEVIPNLRHSTMVKHVHKMVEPGSILYTDDLASYVTLAGTYNHQTVDHSDEVYVQGRAHTQGIENFCSLLKRGIKGTYVQVSPKHLDRYVDERSFTFNERGLSDLGRFSLVLQRVTGRRLTYAELTGGAR